MSAGRGAAQCRRGGDGGHVTLEARVAVRLAAQFGGVAEATRRQKATSESRRVWRGLQRWRRPVVEQTARVRLGAFGRRRLRCRRRRAVEQSLHLLAALSVSARRPAARLTVGHRKDPRERRTRHASARAQHLLRAIHDLHADLQYAI